MSRDTHLTQRSGVYYARISVPKALRELREARGLSTQREIQKSLGTRDPKVAAIRIASFKAATLQEFADEVEALRQEGTRPLREPDEHELHQALWAFKREELHLEEQERVHRPSASEVESLLSELRASLVRNPPSDELALLAHPGNLEYQSARDAGQTAREHRETLVATLQSDLAHSNYVLIDWAIEDLRRRHGWRIEMDSAAYKKLARELMRTWIQILKTADRREQGDDEVDIGLQSNPVTSLSITQVSTQPSRDADPARPRKGETFLDYFDAYLKERKQRRGVSGQTDLRATARQFVECNGSRAVSDYRKSDTVKYKQGLLAYPKNAGKLYPGLKFSQVIERNRKDRHPQLSISSVRNKLSDISAFGQWLEENADGVDADNFKTSLPRNEGKERMEPFSEEEVRVILNSYAFTGSESPRTYQTPGEHRLRD